MADNTGTLDQTLPLIILTARPGWTASLTLPIVTITTGYALHATASLTLPLPTMVGVGGGGNIAALTLPVITLQASGTAPLVGKVEEILPAITVQATMEVGLVADASLTISMLEINARSGLRATLALPSTTLLGAGRIDIVAGLSVPLPAITLIAASKTELATTLNETIPAVKINGSAIQGVVGKLSQTLPRLSLAAHGNHGLVGSLVAELPGTTITARGFQNVMASLNATLPVISLNALVEALPVLGVVLNIENGALTEYEQYPFNALTEFEGVYLAATSAGIFKLGGDKDDGVNIDASLQIPVSDFGTSRLKRIPYVFLGFRSGGYMRVKAISNEVEEQEAKMVNLDPKIHGQRARLGRGVKSRYWSVELENVEGSSFDLDEIELEVEVLDRRG